MKINKPNIVRVHKNTLDQKRMLQDVIDNIKDVPAFQNKKAAIRSFIDVEKSKQGELTISFV